MTRSKVRLKDLSPSIDCRLLLKTLVLGLKNIVWGISSCSPNYRPTSSNAPLQVPITSTSKSSVEETLIFTSLHKNGLKCFSIYSQGPNPHPQEEKDVHNISFYVQLFQILDHFAAVFTMVDARIFQDVFSIQMPFLFDRMLENQVKCACVRVLIH